MPFFVDLLHRMIVTRGTIVTTVWLDGLLSACNRVAADGGER